MSTPQPFHEPVLQKEVLETLFWDEVRTVFDGTLGLGGHAELILDRFSSIQKYIACDLDSEHIMYAKKRLQKWHTKLEIHHSNFSSFNKIVQNEVVRPMVVLLDLGLCSYHVDNPAKGFSFQQDGPLSMAFDGTQAQETAQTILNTQTLQGLTDIFRKYGEEPSARKIADRIVQHRQTEPLRTTGDLRRVIESCIHPKDLNKTLMRVFQAIRIAVNDELRHLEIALHDIFDSLECGDRMGVISYHSLEDQRVKDFFAIQSKPKTIATEFSLHTPVAPARGKLLTKKPIVPSAEEIAANPRSRSAKLRIIEKIS